MHEYIKQSLCSIFNLRKDIVYRRSSSVLIFRNIPTFIIKYIHNFERLAGIGVSLVAF